MRGRRLMILPAIWIAASFSLASCNDGVGSLRLGCPDLQAYSAEEQRAAAEEIRKNPNGELAKMVRDYGQLRKACRV